MSYRIIKKLPSSKQLIREIPLSDSGYQKVLQDQQEVKAILSGEDPRLLMIIGPCSAWPKEAVFTYAEKLSKLSEKLHHALKIVMRVYIQKPRTTKGWTGPVNQPDPFGYPDIEAGAKYTREMMIKVIEMGLPIADEALFTHNAEGFLELLSWVAIGARSAEDQEHRIFASGIDCAVGLKNPTHGSLAIAANSVVAAQHPHVAVFDGNEVETDGNPYAHLVLRGADQKPNYSVAYLEEAKHHLESHKVQNPAIMIDASHDNCCIDGKKDYRLQPKVIYEVIDSLQKHSALKKLVKGFMVESFLKEGNQKLDLENPSQVDLGGLSITDACLGWEKTEEMLLEIVDRLSKV